MLCLHSPLKDSASDLNLLHEYFSENPLETEIVAEEILLDRDSPPTMEEILNLIEQGALITLVVPSLEHLVGKDVEKLRHVLGLLNIHEVRLKSLKENIDSNRDSRQEILSHVDFENNSDVNSLSSRQREISL